MPKPSPERIRAVLNELYTLDPSLRAHEPELTNTIRTLLAAKPDVRINPQFAAKLRSQLAQQPSTPTPNPTPMTKPLFVWIPAAAVATAAVVVAVVITQPNLFGLSPVESLHTPTHTALPATEVSISRVDGRAFGELFAAAGGLGAGAESISARPQSGGGSGNPAPSMAYADTSMTKEGEARETLLIAPAEEYIYDRPRFTYNGELPELAATGDVYRRVKTPITGIGNSLASANLGFLNLSQFENSQVTQFSLTQAGSYGYQIYVDMREGTVSINQDWMSWPQNPAGVYEPLSATSIPDDAALIATANAFLSDHGISTEVYGEPIVDRRWSVVHPYMKGTEMVTDDLKIRWAPDTITVMYPLELNGLTVYDQSGFPYGLSVSVNAREQRVSSVWNLTTLNYQASSYDLVTDAKQILDAASFGDIYYAAPFGQDPNERIRDLTLADPTLVLMQTWHSTENGMGEELLVPALRFPVIADAEGYMGYREAVVVPLVKDLIQPIYRIMDAAGGVATPAAVSNPPTPVNE